MRTPLQTALLATGLACTLGLGSCLSPKVSFERETQTSGTFVSTGYSWTFLSWDLPKPALQVARENAFDAGLSNLQVTESRVTPDLGWWDWLLDIVGYRKAVVRGTWGFTGEELRRERELLEGSSR